MTGDHSNILSPLPAKTGILTRVTASVQLGRGVAGNTTFGLWAACLLALGLGITFIICGYPLYALYGLGMCIFLYLAYQLITWIGVAHKTDAGVTGDEHYASIVATRQMAALNTQLVVEQEPQLSGTVIAVEEIPHAR